MNIGTLLSDGWNTVWNNKWILLLGMLATLAGGGGASGGGGGSGNVNAANQFQDPAFLEEQFGPEAIDRISEGPLGPIIRAAELGLDPSSEDVLTAISGLLAPFTPLIIFSIILGVVMFVVGNFGRAGLIYATNEIAEGRSSNFSDSFSKGTSFFGKA